MFVWGNSDFSATKPKTQGEDKRGRPRLRRNECMAASSFQVFPPFPHAEPRLVLYVLYDHRPHRAEHGARSPHTLLENFGQVGLALHTLVSL